MADFDKYMEGKYSFCRFSDNINIYCESEEKAKEDNGGVYLNIEGKKLFIRELEHKLSSKISVNGQKISYDNLMKEEVHKIVKVVQDNEKYKPFKYT